MFVLLLFSLQLDLEMSFVRSDGIMSLMEDLLSSTIPRLCPELQMTPTPFPRMPYSEAMAKVCCCCCCCCCSCSWLKYVVVVAVVVAAAAVAVFVCVFGKVEVVYYLFSGHQLPVIYMLGIMVFVLPYFLE